jgi:predicted aspartyl protease|tara:strand:+ start:44 stop:160 length:117 start_codon:yes stop_codon:yes gene_type:complete
MKTTLPITIFPIEDDGYHLKITLIVNGKPANMIIDTGA